MSSIVKSEYVFVDDKKANIKVSRARSTDPKEELYDIYNQREIIIKEAKDEALKIINSAKRNAISDIADSKKRGYEDGYNSGVEVGKNKGYKEGYELGRASAKDDYNEELNRAKEELNNQKEELVKETLIKLDEINRMLREIEEEKQNIISEFRQEIDILPVEIAEKIIRQKIEINDNALAAIIESVIREYKNAEWVKIYISDKDDVDKIKADKSLIAELQKISENVKIETLKDLEKSSVIVETPDSIVDASVGVQLNNLKEILLNK